MTAINLSTQVPNGINSLEKINVWAGIALATVNPTQQVLVAVNQTQPQASYTVFRAADDELYISLNQIIKLDPSWATDNATKIWQKAMDVSNTVLPAGLTSN